MKPLKQQADAKAQAEAAAQAAKLRQLGITLDDHNWTEITIRSLGSLIIIRATDPQGVARSGAREDGDGLVNDLLGLGAAPPPRVSKPEEIEAIPEAERIEAPSPPTELERVEGLGYDDESDPQAELERLRAENEELRKQVEPPSLSPQPDAMMIPPDLAQLMMDNEPLPEAVARLTPSIEELLDMAQALSDASMEQAISSFPEDRFEEWTERLWAEKARLRTKRGTDEENLSRENLISRVAGLFMRVGAKR